MTSPYSGMQIFEIHKDLQTLELFIRIQQRDQKTKSCKAEKSTTGRHGTEVRKSPKAIATEEKEVQSKTVIAGRTVWKNEVTRHTRERTTRDQRGKNLVPFLVLSPMQKTSK